MNPTYGRTGDPNNTPPDSNDVGNILGLRTVPTFGGAFAGQAGPSQGQVFKYTMVGTPPSAGGTTRLPANIDEISWNLLNPDGSVFQTVKFEPFSHLTLRSPNFRSSAYTSSPTITQFADAVQRAEFYQSLEPQNPWHTLLEPSVKSKVTINVPYFVDVAVGSQVIQARTYFTGTARDGNTFVLMLDLVFNFLFDNEFVSDIEAGVFATDAFNIIAFPNTFLYSLNVSNPNVPGSCCELGFHTYFLDHVVPQDRWLGIFGSWISPGLFGTSFLDVTALSHEISETFNDPFLDNATPIWQFPGQPANSTMCQGNLETGDPIEGLPDATFPVTLDGYTYHPQNEALLPWFGMGTSNALNGAFSYPDTTVLPHAALPCP